MPRYRATIEYDGTSFVGWQVQSARPSIQSALQAAVRGFSGEDVIVHGAGRTDAGVHAEGQVCHFDLEREWPADKVRDAVNFHLKPSPIAVVECHPAQPSFDARFSAIARHYRYEIVTRRAPLALRRNRAWRIANALDIPAMHAAAQHLVGKHDFTTFRAAGCQAKSPVKTLDRLDVVGDGKSLAIYASARSFLHHQVRSIVGSLRLVGDGRWRPSDIAEALAARDRAACGPVAPASGLYLVRVDYPPDA